MNWRPVVYFEGIYEVSDTGVVRSLDRTTYNGRWGGQSISGKTLKPCSASDYLRVTLYKSDEKIPFRKSVHKLVAEAFIPNPENKPYANHLDGDKRNNCVENLEWCTAKENFDHAVETGLYNRPKKCKINQKNKMSNRDAAFFKILIKRYNFSNAELSSAFNMNAGRFSEMRCGKSFNWITL